MSLISSLLQFAAPAQGIGLSNTVAEAVNDSVIEAVDAQVPCSARASSALSACSARARVCAC